jgi:2-dehydropantoate 2-reductase
MHFLVYGAGALGQALGCLLAAAGHEVVLVLRQRYIEALGAGGLRVTGIFGEYRTAPGQLALWPDLQGRNGERFDYVLLTTKTYDTAAALAEIAALAGCHCPVVSLQNGCGNLEQLISVVGAVRSLAARVITGFEIEAPGTVRITVSADWVHIGGSERGVIPPAAANLAAVLDRAGLPSLAVADVHQSLFAKLLYNCALNPLGAVLGVHYCALAESASARGIMDTVIAETFAVIRSMGGTLPWSGPEVYSRLFYDQLVPATCHHRPSMLQDIEQGKPTEVDAMVGYVAAQGERHGVATPCCRLMAELVRAREQTAGVRART